VPELLVNPDPTSSNGSEICVVGTFWAPGDLGSYIREKCPEYHIRITPALHFSKMEDAENVKWIQNADQGDLETNYPENPAFSTDYYKAMMNDPEKELVFWTQHMNMPEKPTMLTKFEASWFRYAHLEDMLDEMGKERQYIVPEGQKEGGKMERWRLDSVPLYMAIDPGGFAETKLIKRGSRNAIIVAGQPADSAKKFVVDAYAGRLKEPSAFIEKVFEMWKKWRPRAAFIETFGQQEYIRKDIIERAKLACPGLKLSPTPHDVSADAKNDRICALLPRFENGEVYFLNGMAYGSDLRAEIRAYPNSLTVDLADALGWLNTLTWTRRPSGDADKANAERLRKLAQARSPLTGY